jgi:hypothetical protein
LAVPDIAGIFVSAARTDKRDSHLT